MAVQALNKLSDDWNHITSLVIYGYGRKAVRLIDFIAKDFEIKYIIDNNPMLKEKKIQKTVVQELAQVKDDLKGRKIIVTTGGWAYVSIKDSLENIGLQEYRDFCRYEDFLVEWYWKNKKQIILSECYLSITSRCNFRCKNCDQLMPYYTERDHFECSVYDIEKTMDALFSKADYLVSLFVLGGEPLLHKGLPEILQKICEKYKDKVGYLQLITNGSLLPDENLMRIIKQNDIDIRLSDYTCAIPYEKRFNEVKEKLRENGITCSISKHEEWYDIGIPENKIDQYKTEDELKQHVMDCGPCHIVADQKFYYCGVLYNSEKCGFTKLSDTDYIDLTEESTPEKKEMFLAYSIGEFANGYPEICNRCYGKSGKNTHSVKPAEQMEDKKCHFKRP